MKKLNYILLILFFFLVGAITLTLANSAKGETTTTFPVDEAGIAAYTKLDFIDTTAIKKACHTIEKHGESYVIGTVNVPGSNFPPHVYVGMDGWIVAYYLKTEEASRIWKYLGTSTIETTTLKEAIDIVSQQMGVSYSSPIQYYDFAFPKANKLTLIVEGVNYSNKTNSFYVTVPGTLYEASYNISGEICSTNTGTTLGIKIDGTYVHTESQSGWYDCRGLKSSGYFNLSVFQPNVVHQLTFYCGYCPAAAYAVALIYQN